MKRWIPLLLIVALVVPVLLAVPVSAADFSSTNRIGVSINPQIWNGSSYDRPNFLWQESYSTNSSFQGYFVFRLYDTSDSSYVYFPVGDDLSKIIIHSALDFSPGQVINSVSSNISAFAIKVACYDSSKNFIASVVNYCPVDLSSTGTYYLSVSGLEFPAGTSFFNVYSSVGSLNVTNISPSSNSLSNSYFSGSFSFDLGFSVKTSYCDWISSGLSSMGHSSSPFVFSHSGQDVYLSLGDRLTFVVMALGFSEKLEISVISNSSGVSRTNVLSYFDPLLHLEAFSGIPPDTNEYATLSYQFLINGNVVYITDTCTVYYSGWQGGSPGSGGSSDSDVMDSLDRIQISQDEALEIMNGNSEKLDKLSDQVEQLPDEIKDGMQQLQEQEKQEASSTGDSSAQEVIEIIPNPSDDFLPAIQNLVSVMSYDGTAAVLSMPAVSIPAIGNIVPNIKLLDAQDIDLGEYVTLVPDLILNFIRALFDSALVLYCLYELFTMIGSALSGFSKTIGKGDLYE